MSEKACREEGSGIGGEGSSLPPFPDQACLERKRLEGLKAAP